MRINEYWIAFGDIHDDISTMLTIPELPGATGVIVTGDMTLGGGIKQAARVLAPLADAPQLYAQIGNMDREEVTAWLEEKGWNLHGRARRLFPDVMAVGVGCSPFTPFGTPSEHPEARLAEWMEQAIQEAKNLSKIDIPRTLCSEAGQQNLATMQAQRAARVHMAQSFSEISAPTHDTAFLRLVLVAHTPPYASACDRLHNGVAVGSKAVREFIEEYQPDVCLCGHIHESRAEDFIGKTHVLNPGTVGGGGYAIIWKEGTGVDVRVRAKLMSL